MPALVRPELVAEAFEEAEQGKLDLSGFWIGRRRGRILGVVLTQHLAGRAGAVWAPEVVTTWGRAALAASLVRAALRDLRARGVRIAQALIDSSSPRQGAADLTRGGLPRVTELTYLGRDTATSLAVKEDLPRFQWRPFEADSESEFREVLEATYAGSLDMPELEGARTLDDILASHRAGGRFDASRWQVGRLAGEPGASAIMLLAAPPDRDTWEVSYLGLTPPARRRGLGRAALSHALALAQPHVPRLELAVDARNLPAERLYLRAGFVPFDRRTVHLKVL
jgi:ribosomal protein S18 acetylase RimI-like enzyme